MFMTATSWQNRPTDSAPSERKRVELIIEEMVAASGKMHERKTHEQAYTHNH